MYMKPNTLKNVWKKRRSEYFDVRDREGERDKKEEEKQFNQEFMTSHLFQEYLSWLNKNKLKLFKNQICWENKTLNPFMKNKILLIYTENKPIVDYTRQRR
jgi:hypothetical protein